MATGKAEDAGDGGVSLGQKMLSAVSGSVFTSLLGEFFSLFGLFDARLERIATPCYRCRLLCLGGGCVIDTNIGRGIASTSQQTED